MEQRISLFTLGCRDVAAETAFYEAMGWRRVESPDGLVVFDLIGQALGLYDLDALATDMGVAPGTLGHGAATFGHNVREKPEVAAVLDAARSAGATILREASDVVWGGHIGYFADPEGHVWEVAWNPFSTLSPEGAFRWSGY